ncbi:hypothetical protein [Leptospira yasudae]|nr:hypothetical protein [Leptospira yasudae]
MILHICEQKKEKNVISLLPTEMGGGISFSNEEIIKQSAIYSPFYETLIISTAKKLVEAFRLEPESALVISRVGIVPLAHFFMDRLIRLHRTLQINGKVAIAENAGLKSVDIDKNEVETITRILGGEVGAWFVLKFEI